MPHIYIIVGKNYLNIYITVGVHVGIFLKGFDLGALCAIIKLRSLLRIRLRENDFYEYCKRIYYSILIRFSVREGDRIYAFQIGLKKI